MISESERSEKKLRIHDIGQFVQSLKDFGKSIFKREKAHDMYSEIEAAIFNETRCVFIVDDKPTTISNYIAVFVTDSRGFVAIPCLVEEGKITMFNVKDILKDDYPNWYISRYEEIGKTRDLSSLSVSFDFLNRKV